MLTPSVRPFRGQFKPSGIPRIDWTHPLAQGLVFYGFDAGNGPIELVAGRTRLSYGTPPQVFGGPDGPGLLWHDNGGAITGPTHYFAADDAIRKATANGNYTYACAIRKTGTMGWVAPFGRNANNPVYSNWDFEINSNSNGQNDVYYPICGGASSFFGLGHYTGLTDNSFVTLAASIGKPDISGNWDYGIYARGTTVLKSSINTNTATPSSSDANDQIFFSGNSGGGSSNGGMVGYVYYGAFWGRVLNDNEHALLQADPYCFLIFPEDDFLIQDAGTASGRTGSLAVTLDNATLVATGALKIQAAVAATLGALTLSATSTLKLQGALAATLADATLSATATLKLQGALNATLGDATLIATGQLVVKGAVNATLDNATLSATGVLPIKGALNVTLDDVTVSAQGNAGGNTGTLNGQLDDATLVASGKLALKGAVNATLDNATLAATATVKLQAVLAVTLDNATLAATGKLKVQGALNATLQDATLVATATTNRKGSLAVTLDDATLAATGKLVVKGSVNITLDNATLVATGDLSSGGIYGETPIYYIFVPSSRSYVFNPQPRNWTYAPKG